jgi:hypothetical protein
MLESFKRALPGGTVHNFSSRNRSISPINDRSGPLEVVNEVFKLRRKDVSVDIELSGSPVRPSKVTVQHLSPGKEKKTFRESRNFKTNLESPARSCVSLINSQHRSRN